MEDQFIADLKLLEAELINFMRDYKVPGLSVSVLQGDEIIYSRGFGSRDLENDLPVTPDTVFGIGSVTKSFICFAIQKLASENKLSVEDPVSKHLNLELGSEKRPITIHHLMSHSSGIPSLGTSLVRLARDVLKLETYIPLTSKEDFFNFINNGQKFVIFKPGDHYYYFNGGYVLLAMIIEKLSGKTLAEYLGDIIFTPLGMKNTILKQSDFETNHNTATGYHISNDGEPISSQPHFNFMGLGPGGICSSTNDLLKYTQMMLDNGTFEGKTLLDAKLIEEMTTPYMKTQHTDYEYGYGWGITKDFMGHHMISHSGSTLNYGAYLAYIPEQKLGIAVLANNGNAPLKYIQSFLALLLGKNLFEVPMLRIREKFITLLGDYIDYSTFNKAKITMENGMLYYHHSIEGYSQTKLPLIPKTRLVDNNEFYIYNLGSEMRVEFVKRDDDLYLLVERNCYIKK